MEIEIHKASQSRGPILAHTQVQQLYKTSDGVSTINQPGSNIIDKENKDEDDMTSQADQEVVPSLHTAYPAHKGKPVQDVKPEY
jgi:hypothetical protein